MKSIGSFIEKTRTVFGIQSLSDCVEDKNPKSVVKEHRDEA